MFDLKIIVIHSLGVFIGYINAEPVETTLEVMEEIKTRLQENWDAMMHFSMYSRDANGTEITLPKNIRDNSIIRMSIVKT